MNHSEKEPYLYVSADGRIPRCLSSSTSIRQYRIPPPVLTLETDHQSSLTKCFCRTSTTMNPRHELNLGEALRSDVLDPNFLPCPQITLYVGPESSLGLCGICQTTRLQLNTRTTGDSSVAIIPCGHIACRQCMEKCLQTKPNCPFCRVATKYELCCHPLEARGITKENLLFIPETIPMGGKIPDQCLKCRVETNRVANESILKPLAECFQALREQYRTFDNQKKAVVNHKLRTVQKQFHLVAKSLSAETTEALASQW